MRTTIHRRNFFFYFLDTARDRPVPRHRNKTTGELNLLYQFVTVFIFVYLHLEQNDQPAAESVRPAAGHLRLIPYEHDKHGNGKYQKKYQTALSRQ